MWNLVGVAAGWRQHKSRYLIQSDIYDREVARKCRGKCCEKGKTCVCQRDQPVSGPCERGTDMVPCSMVSLQHDNASNQPAFVIS